MSRSNFPGNERGGVLRLPAAFPRQPPPPAGRRSRLALGQRRARGAATAEPSARLTAGGNVISPTRRRAAPPSTSADARRARRAAPAIRWRRCRRRMRERTNTSPRPGRGSVRSLVQTLPSAAVVLDAFLLASATRRTALPKGRTGWREKVWCVHRVWRMVDSNPRQSLAASPDFECRYIRPLMPPLRAERIFIKAGASFYRAAEVGAQDRGHGHRLRRQSEILETASGCGRPRGPGRFSVCQPARGLPFPVRKRRLHAARL